MNTTHSKSDGSMLHLWFVCLVAACAGLPFVIKFLMPEPKGPTIEEIERSWLTL